MNEVKDVSQSNSFSCNSSAHASSVMAPPAGVRGEGFKTGKREGFKAGKRGGGGKW